jgi:hypothetical protein
MDWLSFLASVVGSVAWPVTVLAVVLILRKELVALLPFLRRLKAGPVEAEFERQVKELKNEVAQALPEELPQALEGRERLLKLAEISPRAAILEAWQGVEFAARRVATHYGGSPVPDVRSPSRLTKELAKLSQVSVDDLALIQDLRGLRNQATHSPDFSPSYEAVANYIQLASALQARLQNLADPGGA